MKMFLYNTDDGINVINKTLNNEVEININLKRDTDILNPEIVLKGDFRGFNYAYIPDLNRYYFINSMEQLNLQLVKLSLECDVLETYKNDIISSNARFKRNIKDGDFENITIDYSNQTTVNKLYSDAPELTGSTTIISVIGG